jgi:hypothetical protein
MAIHGNVNDRYFVPAHDRNLPGQKETMTSLFGTKYESIESAIVATSEVRHPKCEMTLCRLARGNVNGFDVG